MGKLRLRLVTPVSSLLCQGGSDPKSSSVLSFPILKQGENGSCLGMLEGGPRRRSDKRIASLGSLNPEGLAGASGRRGRWPGRGQEAP